MNTQLSRVLSSLTLLLAMLSAACGIVADLEDPVVGGDNPTRSQGLRKACPDCPTLAPGAHLPRAQVPWSAGVGRVEGLR
jgi:hypothetical protein